MRITLAFLLLLSFVIPASGQVSVSASIGPLGDVEHGDPYALKAQWVAKSGSGPDQSTSVVFFESQTGLVKTINLMYEATPHFSVGLIFQDVDFTMEVNKRSGHSTSLGALIRVNFTSNEKKVIPFVQGAYMFTNTSTIKQELATSAIYPTQTQPAYERTASTNLGIAADLGIEFKVGKAWALQVTGGLHGIQVVPSDDGDFFKNLNYGSYVSPSDLDGVFFLAFQGGIKYYFGKGSKKRDF